MQQWNWVENEQQLNLLTGAFLGANPADLARVVGAEVAALDCRFTDDDQAQGWSLQPQGLEVRLTAQSARRLQANSLAFRWASGGLTAPTLMGLLRTGILDRVREGQESVAAIGQRLARHPDGRTHGNIWGALHLLELQGWATRRGQGEETRFVLTPLGVEVVYLAETHRATLEQLCADIPSLRHYHPLCQGQRQEAAAITRLQGYVAASNREWGLPTESEQPHTRLAARQLVDCLDGLALGTALVAMGMPLYEKRGARITPVGESALAPFLATSKWLNLNELPANLSRPFIGAVFDWLLPRHLAERQGEGLRLTEQGRLVLGITPPLAALGISYLKSYEQIDDLLIGSGDPCGIDQDTHVDRVMNVYGSSGAGSGPGSKIINEQVLKHYFDTLPLEQQPAGIADIGCGDGTSLKRLADYILSETRRGRELARFPLVVIGADYNDQPLELTRETLAPLEAIDGVIPLVVKADISDPDAYDASLQASGVQRRDPQDGTERPLRLDDLLHTFMFLIHNRRLQVTETHAATAIIRTALENCEREELAHVYRENFAGELPSSDSAALERLLEAFDMAFSGSTGLVPGQVAVADLIDFMQRWKPYARHGLISLEGHSPSRYEEAEPIDTSTHFLRADKLPHPLNWGMHFQSRQLMLPYNQYRLALALAGFRPHDGQVYGGINPPMLPSVESLPQQRFFSIGCYVPASH